MRKFERAELVCPNCDAALGPLTFDVVNSIRNAPQSEWPRQHCVACSYQGIVTFRVFEQTSSDELDDFARTIPKHVRDRAHLELDRWFVAVQREQPDLAAGEEAVLRFRAGYCDSHCDLTVRHGMEKGV